MPSGPPPESSGPHSLGGELRAAEKYRDIAQLGTGGMGEVYLSVAQAGLEGFNKLLVVKRIRQSFAEDPDVLNMFLNEARLAARLMHPNVVQTNEVGFDGKRHFIAMEYLDGQSLVSVLRRAHAMKQRFPLAMHIRVLTEALGGLHYAHELADFDGTPLNIVHRDATPHNVFVTYDGQVKIVDFGIAKVGQSGDTRSGEFKGKVPYMAPEQVMQTSLDRRCDIFAVGVMLWEAVAQLRMWKGVSDVQIMYSLHRGEIRKLADVAPGTPPKLLAIVDRALARDLAERYQTAAEMQADLEAFLPTIGAPPTNREVGQWVAEAFADARKRIRSSIDTQIRMLKERPSALVVPPLQLGTGSAGSAPGSGGSGESETPQRPEHTPSNLQAAMMSSSPSSSYQHHPRSNARLVGTIAAILAVSGLIVFAVVNRSSRNGTASASSAVPVNGTTATPTPSDEKPAPGAPPASSGAQIAAPTAGNVVVLEVKVTPPEAKVTIDDAELTSGTARYAKDGLSHRIRIEAPGFATKSQWVVFDGAPIKLDIKLDKLAAYAPVNAPKNPPPVNNTAVAVPSKPPTSATTTTAAAAATTATATSDFDKKPPKPPKSSIDTSDPFK
jgi:eukaryotic-like serine/threonine-protein kinase